MLIFSLFGYFPSHGYAFLAASEFTGDVSKFVDNIEDVIAQADEVDDKYLQVNVVHCKKKKFWSLHLKCRGF